MPSNLRSSAVMLCSRLAALREPVDELQGNVQLRARLGRRLLEARHAAAALGDGAVRRREQVADRAVDQSPRQRRRGLGAAPRRRAVLAALRTRPRFFGGEVGPTRRAKPCSTSRLSCWSCSSVDAWCATCWACASRCVVFARASSSAWSLSSRFTASSPTTATIASTSLCKAAVTTEEASICS